jgi:hypothetical protein
MTHLITPKDSQANLVNYVNVLTSISNEIYTTNTDPEDSLAFMIKNNVLINFSVEPATENKEIQRKTSAAI